MLFMSLALVIALTLPALNTAYALEAGWTVTSPVTVNFTATPWSLQEQEMIVTFGEVVDVSNTLTTLGGFTLEVTATELEHATDPALFMGYDQLEVKTGALVAGEPDGITVLQDGIYAAFSGILSESDPITLMTADARSRNAGSWTVTPTLRLTIPAKQKIGTYTSTITFTLL